MNQSNSKKVISRVSSYIFRHKWLFGLTLSLACVMTVVTVVVPLAIQKVLDSLFSPQIEGEFFLLEGITIIACLFLLKEILNCLRIRTNNKLEQKVIYKLRSDLHKKLLNLPISFYDKRKSGDIASRVVEDVQNV